MSTNGTATKILAVIGAFSLFLLFVPLWSIGQAYVLRQVWGWYAVRDFGMPELRLTHCFLASYVVSLLVSQAIPESAKKKDDSPWATLIGQALAWMLLLGLAWWLR